MKQTDYTTRVLAAEPGHKLTEADEAVAIEARTITDRVYLAATDSPERWREITDAEADAILAAQREAAEAAEAAEIENTNLEMKNESAEG